ncbi:MAG: hypothetical protein J6X44_06780 [Thermoguttaceae bacterium]|nr:hypothetical protein [Thermoguttaceae bacterium]
MFFFVVLKAFGLSTAFTIATLLVVVESGVAVYAIVRLCRKERSDS